jgi:hypothetical protein
MMSYGYPSGVPLRQPPKSSSMLVWIGVAFGGLFVVVAIVTLVSIGSCLSRNDDEGGARLANEIPPAVLTRLEKSAIVEPNEAVLAYYDATVAVDGREVAVLTSTRIVYAKKGHNTAIALHDVKRVRHREEPLLGDVIEITATGGRSMKIEIAPLNNGATFLRALTDAVADNGGSTG